MNYGIKRTPEREARIAAISRTGLNRKKGKGRPDVSDPAYSADQIEFMLAMEANKRATYRQFPTPADVLAVAKSLGYAKTT